MPREIRFLITGGGTGGHVGPALAIVQKLRERAATPDSPFTPVFCYMGSANGVEAGLARENGLPFVGVATGKFRRWSNARRFFEFLLPNLRDGLKQPLGLLEALTAVRRFRPDVTVSTGGYVSVPPVIASRLLGVPVLTHEQTVTIGLANRITARFATRIALTFEGAAEELPPSLRRRTFVTGNPVREAIFQGDRTRAARRFGFVPEEDDLPCLYVTGGAQGAALINRSVESVLGDLLALPCRIVHQCGKQPEDWEQDFDRLTRAAAALTPALAARFHVTRFVGSEAIGDAYALCDLLVGRSGAGTVTEVCALGKPAIFVPKVPTGGDEQTRNARRLADAGAALLLPQKECDGPRLLREITSLANDPTKRAAMREAALRLARPDAADALADAVLGLVRR
ncbi:MAG: UDP-N-acetylglucosamine--N-acetylmuramyl-(pentapeptide) pyrophosphoryl-undecaprenol N-acetylglucosamine transferase [Capsulimonadales bacterium]|nr:UDP-N-acetylglucosamine--N-acetylmuramyl-(pentapeptide) pyrophosphoryl-undecaprenol N-acetylglucosamine transferase [Capsulimonadales bacterium]